MSLSKETLEFVDRQVMDFVNHLDSATAKIKAARIARGENPDEVTADLVYYQAFDSVNDDFRERILLADGVKDITKDALGKALMVFSAMVEAHYGNDGIAETMNRAKHDGVQSLDELKDLILKQDAEKRQKNTDGPDIGGKRRMDI